MNEFDRQIEAAGVEALRSLAIETLQVNVGLRCNQRCAHCHVSASPERSEMMTWPTMELVLDAAARVDCRLVDITGGAPELNPDLRKFIAALKAAGHTVQLRTNLTVLLEPGMEALPDWLAEHGVRLVASLPCYLEENIRAQRGDGVYEKSVEAMKKLNAIGYGIDPELPLTLVYNPGGPLLPPAQDSLEADYRDELGSRFGISFSGLIAITNVPVGRFLNDLRRRNREREYLSLLRNSFNPETIEGLMCRRQVNIGWDGTLFDCDFNLALGLAVDHGAPDHIVSFDPDALGERRIVTGEHCFGCTAGRGSSCGGALA
jgi:radical SAM/Cys-rich protein